MVDKGRICFVACGASIAVYLTYRAFRNRIRKYLNKQDHEKIVKEVLFFPDKGFPCYAYLNDNNCHQKHCALVHEPTSLSRLKSFVKSAEKSLKICVFVITCQDLADAAVSVIKRRVPVQVITDATMEDASGSQIAKFRREGVPVRTLASTFLMHHKFALVDDNLLVVGSFNWTQTAVIGNLESILVTNEPSVVKLFVAEFDRLWNLMDPVECKGNKHWGDNGACM